LLKFFRGLKLEIFIRTKTFLTLNTKIEREKEKEESKSIYSITFFFGAKVSIYII